MANNLAIFTKESPISYCFKSKLCPLIKITQNGDISYSKTKKEKRKALIERLITDKFIISWCGQYSTDVFELNEDDILTALFPED